METIKHLITTMTIPSVLLTTMILFFFLVFPPSERLSRWNQKLRIYKIWTNIGGLAIFVILISLLSFSLKDENFRVTVLKPDNVPIIALFFLVPFFLWFSMKQAMENDARILKKEKPDEHGDGKVLVWPDLVYIELLCLIFCTVLLIVWSNMIKAPLEEPADPIISPNPSKAPWYFVGLQEMLVYFDPWLAGVVLPMLIIAGLIAIPYLDKNTQGIGYYCFGERKKAISLFLFGWLVLWISLIFIGMFLRGPNWNFFGPFEKWDALKVEPLTTVNLSEYLYVVCLNRGLPQNIFLREISGILLMGTYFLILPVLLARTLFKDALCKLGTLRYSIFVFLLLVMLSLPFKMYLRWLFKLKYILAIPEYSFNI